MEKQRRTPKEDALEHIVAHRDKSFLEQRFIDSFKGRFILHYRITETLSLFLFAKVHEVTVQVICSCVKVQDVKKNIIKFLNSL